MKPRGLDQAIEEVVFTTLDIDLDEINAIDAQLVEHRRYIADLHLGCTEGSVRAIDRRAWACKSQRRHVIAIAEPVVEGASVAMLGKSLYELRKGGRVGLECEDRRAVALRDLLRPLAAVGTDVQDDTSIVDLDVDEDVRLRSRRLDEVVDGSPVRVKFQHGSAEPVDTLFLMASVRGSRRQQRPLDPVRRDGHGNTPPSRLNGRSRRDDPVPISASVVPYARASSDAPEARAGRRDHDAEPSGIRSSC